MTSDRSVRLRRLRAGFGLVALLLGAPAPLPASAAAAVVGTGTSDGCSEAALDAALGCGPASGMPLGNTCTAGGAITFSCGPLPTTITVTAQKVLAADTSIDGGGLVALSGGGTSPVLAVNAGVVVSLTNLTISDGTDLSVGGSGSAIANSGQLTVTQSTFSGNYAAFGGAIFNSGTLTVSDSVFSGNQAVEGAAIENTRRGTLTVARTTLSGNSGTDGGAVYNAGTATVNDSTISGNRASFGGAVFNSGPFTASGDSMAGNHATDGGAFTNSSEVTVSDSTFSGNSALKSGGAVENNAGTFVATNVTFAGNSAQTGAAIASFITDPGDGVTLTNTIVAQSTAGANCYIAPGAALADGGNNIDDGATCGFTGAGCATTSGDSFCATDPRLDPAGLADNGGPTDTIALTAGSPAVDAGNPGVCAGAPVNDLDQRGFARPGHGAANCSIGAYEYDSTCAAAVCAAPPGTPTPTATPAPPPTPGPCVGDCDHSGAVTINELITGVNIALGSLAATTCPDFQNAQGMVDIAQLIKAVNAALNGCID